MEEETEVEAAADIPAPFPKAPIAGVGLGRMALQSWLACDLLQAGVSALTFWGLALLVADGGKQNKEVSLGDPVHCKNLLDQSQDGYFSATASLTGKRWHLGGDCI